MFSVRDVCMTFGRFLPLARLIYLFVFVLPLIACSGGDGGAVGVVAGGNSVMLSWTAPTERQDSATPMALNDIAGYNIYYRAVTGSYNDQVPIYIGNSNHAASMRVRIGDIFSRSGTYQVVVTTVDIDGRESTFSAPEVEVTF